MFGGIEAIVVSDGHLEETEYLSLDKVTIKVLELSKVKYFDKSKVVYINTVISGNKVVEKNLKEKGINAIINVEKRFPDIIKEYANYYCKKIGIDLAERYIMFKNVKVYNPCFISPDFSDIIFGTMGDEIIPAVYDEYSLTVDGAYEWGKVKCEKDDIVIDAGANIGLFACYAADKGCKVYACEPDRQALLVLEEQKKIYPENIEIIPMGLSDKKGKIKFYESDDCSLSSIGMPRGNVSEVEIEIISIDELIESERIPYVSYIKADIEGAEREMLRGAVKTLKEFGPKLSICTYHYPEDKELLESIILEANPNYIVEHHWRKLYAYVPEKQDDAK